MSDAPRAFLYLGPEEGLKADEIASQRQRLERHAGAPAEEHRFYLPDGSVKDAIDALQNGSLFSSHRLVILAGVDQLRKKADLAPLLAYLESPNPDATLILTSESVRVDPRLEKAVPGAGRKVFWELFENQKQTWVTGYFRKHKVAISEAAVDLFLEIVENNTQELRDEAAKLCTYVGTGGEVTEEVIDAFIYHSRDESVFTLFKHICEDSFEPALAALDKLTASGDAAPIQIVGGLAFQVRRLLALRLLLDNGIAMSAAFERLGIRGKRIQADYRAGAARFPAPELERAIHLLTEYDSLFRSQRPGIHRCLLDLLIYQLMFRSDGLVRPPGLAADDRPLSEERDALVR
jgi:DNA polymerase-3 subunit delta